MHVPTCITKRTKVSGIQNHAAAWQYLEADSPALRVHSTSVTSVTSSVASDDGTSMTNNGGTRGPGKTHTHNKSQLCCMEQLLIQTYQVLRVVAGTWYW